MFYEEPYKSKCCCGQDGFDKKPDEGFDCGFGKCFDKGRQPERKPCFCCNVVFNCRPCPPPPKPKPCPPPKPCCIPFWGCICVDGFHGRQDKID